MVEPASPSIAGADDQLVDEDDNSEEETASESSDECKAIGEAAPTVHQVSAAIVENEWDMMLAEPNRCVFLKRQNDALHRQLRNCGDFIFKILFTVIMFIMGLKILKLQLVKRQANRVDAIDKLKRLGAPKAGENEENRSKIDSINCGRMIKYIDSRINKHSKIRYVKCRNFGFIKLLIILIIFLSKSKIANGLNDCQHKQHGFLIEIPKSVSCNPQLTVESPKIVNISLYVPRYNPLYIQASKCYRISRKICTHLGFFGSKLFKIAQNFYRYQSLNVNMLRNTKNTLGKNLFL